MPERRRHGPAVAPASAASVECSPRRLCGHHRAAPRLWSQVAADALPQKKSAPGALPSGAPNRRRSGGPAAASRQQLQKPGTCRRRRVAGLASESTAPPCIVHGPGASAGSILPGPQPKQERQGTAIAPRRLDASLQQNRAQPAGLIDDASWGLPTLGQPLRTRRSGTVRDSGARRSSEKLLCCPEQSRRWVAAAIAARTGRGAGSLPGAARPRAGVRVPKTASSGRNWRSLPGWSAIVASLLPLFVAGGSAGSRRRYAAGARARSRSRPGDPPRITATFLHRRDNHGLGGRHQRPPAETCRRSHTDPNARWLFGHVGTIAGIMAWAGSATAAGGAAASRPAPAHALSYKASVSNAALCK